MEPNLFRYIWQHSRSEQLRVLLMILASLPFYWMSLDIPKRIVNDALQGRAFQDGNTEATLFSFSLPLPDSLGGSLQLLDGFSFDQLGYLLALSFLFLFFVICNGAFKYYINIRKGILSERMLRRMRFELFARLMRFRPEQIRAVKPAEAASMIKDEVEPVGGFIGDAFIQPAFLGLQALTALLFILVQSVWLGGVALAIVLVQAFLIPYLRREQLRLGRLRQIASRRLAGRIGEMVDTAPMIHGHGLKGRTEAEIGNRLGGLFDIRAALYKRKFAVKYLNNLLAQITPFFFYAIGGYFALRGTLDIGQLVAVIAAYRDLPPPVKELIDWDQRRADVGIKYEQVITQFAGKALMPDDARGEHVTIPADAPINVRGLTVNDQRGTPLLQGATLTLPRPAHIAIVGSSSSGRDYLVRAIGRQITEYEGRVEIGGHPVAQLPDRAAAKVMSYAPPDPILFAGSVRDNIEISLRTRAPSEDGDADERRLREAQLSGNPLVTDDGDWIDYEAAGVASQDELEARLIDVLSSVGLTDALYSYGLQGRLPADADPELLERVLAARGQIRTALDEQGLSQLVSPFDFTQFNDQMTLRENLLFGVLRDNPEDPGWPAFFDFYTSVVHAESLYLPVIEIGLRIAENSVEVFSDLPAGHPIFDRFSMVKSDELEDYKDLIRNARAKDGIENMSTESVRRLIRLATEYVEPRHRLGLVTEEFKERTLRARFSIRRHLPDVCRDQIEFYDEDKVTMTAAIRDNLLFGRTAQGVANAEQRVSDFLRKTLPKLELDDLIYSLGLDYDVGPGGRALFAEQRAAITLARSLVRQPNILIMEDALKAFGRDDAGGILQRTRQRFEGRTLITTLDPSEDATDFDMVVTFEGARAMVSKEMSAEKPGLDDRDEDADHDDAAPPRQDAEADETDLMPQAALDRETR